MESWKEIAEARQHPRRRRSPIILLVLIGLGFIAVVLALDFQNPPKSMTEGGAPAAATGAKK